MKAFQKSIVQLAASGVVKSQLALFETFIPKSENVLEVKFLGTRGIWGIGISTFAAITERRVAWIEYGPLREFHYNEIERERLESVSMNRPSLLWLPLFLIIGGSLTGVIAAMAGNWILGLIESTSEFFLISNLFVSLMATIVLGFGIYLSLRVFYRVTKCGIILYLKARNRSRMIPCLRKYFKELIYLYRQLN